jgi:hypothetical protein
MSFHCNLLLASGEGEVQLGFCLREKLIDQSCDAEERNTVRCRRDIHSRLLL